MKKPISQERLYPNLQSETDLSRSELDLSPLEGTQFRLKKISEIRDFLEKEVNERDKLRRKYKTAWNVFYNVAQVSGLIAVGTGSGAVGTLATGVGAAVSIPLGGIAIAGGTVSAASVALGKAAMKKLEKHESIKRTAESSLNTVNDLVSRALEDGQISIEEFHHILREFDNYRSHKAGIKRKTRTDLIELTAEREAKIRKEGVEQGKKQTLVSLSTLTLNE
jgi:hypothetical protein